MVRRRADLEQHILEVLYEFYRETGYPPTYREVSVRVESAHSNVWHAMKSLRKGGFLRETPALSARSLLLSAAGIERVRPSSQSTNQTSTAQRIYTNPAIDAESSKNFKPIKYRASSRKHGASLRKSSRPFSHPNSHIGGESGDKAS